MGTTFLGQQALWRPGVNSGHRPYLEDETQLPILAAQSDQSSGVQPLKRGSHLCQLVSPVIEEQGGASMP